MNHYPHKRLLGSLPGKRGPGLTGVVLTALFLVTQPDYGFCALLQNAWPGAQTEDTVISRQPLHGSFFVPGPILENRVEEDVKEEGTLLDDESSEINFPVIDNRQIHFTCARHAFRRGRSISLVKLYHTWKYHIS